MKTVIVKKEKKTNKKPKHKTKNKANKPWNKFLTTSFSLGTGQELPFLFQGTSVQHLDKQSHIPLMIIQRLAQKWLEKRSCKWQIWKMLSASNRVVFPTNHLPTFWHTNTSIFIQYVIYILPIAIYVSLGMAPIHTGTSKELTIFLFFRD